MKAFTRDRYGSPDILRLEEVDRPSLPDEAALVRVHATSVNAHDWHMLRGRPFLARTEAGLRRPKQRILGIDVAGTVESVGPAMTRLEPGDRVFGARSGAFAEYVAGKNLVPIPSRLSLEQAAAIPVAGLTALQGLRDRAGVQPGQRVLINGAGGGVGTFAVQIAKALGAEVTATTSPRHVEMVGSLGADEVLDYTKTDFSRTGRRYDAILDIGGHHSLHALRRALVPGGIGIMVAPAPGDWVGFLFRIVGAAVSARFVSRPIRPFLSQVNLDDIGVLARMVEDGAITPVVDRTYPFEQLPDAIRYVESGQACGKVVVTI
jgi:NADPH:quinone reductase-like Zn-dependent oxidoreductase